HGYRIWGNVRYKAYTGGRLINLSSAGHRFSNVDLEDPNFEWTPYEPFVAYGRSKTANILFAVKEPQRLCGPQWLLPLTRSVDTTARTATSVRSCQMTSHHR